MSLLELHGVRKGFGSTVALDGVDFSIESGEVVAIIGENGAGKTTLMNVIAGAARPDEGTVRFKGGRIAYIQQELSLFPHLSVAENILIGREPSRFGVVVRHRLLDEARRLLDEFGRGEISVGARVRDLPPASRQVVEICRALVSGASLILMDEPTSSLERADVDRLFALIRKLCSTRIAVIYVSHFLEEVREIADRAVVLRDGKTVWRGVLRDITDDALIAEMAGRPISRYGGEQTSRNMGRVALEFEPASGGRFGLRCGEILGIAGLVGSGRTRLIRTLAGLNAARSGGMRIHGRFTAFRGWTRARSIRAGFGYLSEDRNADGLIPHLTLRDNITITRPESDDAAEWIARLKIRASSPFVSVRRLSGGNQQKALLARLLHQDAQILLLDEPTRGVDAASKIEIYGYIRQIASNGKAVLIVSSYLPELFAVCDTLAVMFEGNLTPARPIADWTPENVLRAAIGGAA